MKLYFLTDDSEKSLAPFFSKRVLEAVMASVVIVGAFLIPWRNRQHYIRGLIFPTLLLLCIWAAGLRIIENEYTELDWFFSLLYFYGFSFFAVKCHRLILVEENQFREQKLLALLSITLVYLLWFLIVYNVLVFFNALFVMLALSIIRTTTIIFENIPLSELTDFTILLIYFFSLPAQYILGRLSFTFPAIATLDPLKFRKSWKNTHNNGLTMLIIGGIYPWLLIIEIREPWLESHTIVINCLHEISTYIATTIVIFGLSLAYKETNKKLGLK